MKDHEIFDIIKGLNFKTHDFDSAKKILSSARNDQDGIYSKDQKKLFGEILKSDTRYNTAREQKRQEFLETLTDMLKKTSSMYLTDEYLQSYATHNDITVNEAKTVHINAGWTFEQGQAKEEKTQEITIKPFNQIILESTSAIEGYFDEFKKMSQNDRARVSGLESAQSVYDVLVCFYRGVAADYKNKSNAEIVDLINEFGKKHALASSTTAEGIAASILRNAATNIFNSNASREKYNNYIIYRTPTVQEAINVIKMLPTPSLIEPKMANPIIKQLADAFGDDSIAVSLYNHAAKLEDSPYIPKPVQYPTAMEVDWSIDSVGRFGRRKLILNIKISAKTPFTTIPEMVFYANGNNMRMPSQENHSHKLIIQERQAEEAVDTHRLEQEIDWSGVSTKKYNFKLYCNPGEPMEILTTQRSKIS
ncbi:MAG: hypothetical protein FWG63_04655 [Defluviitaleaceae bacterium]|nr:hypothetical protein [Defluviitaleaceae bacterium]